MIDTIIFIGMAGVGKSTIGQNVAKQLNRQFFDIDHILEQQFNAPLQSIIHDQGIDQFHQLEATAVLEHLGNLNIVSPGGSFIYSDHIIQTIKERALFIHLYDSPERIQSRIPDIESRGIIGLSKNTSFETLFYERLPLYQTIAHVTFSIEFKSFNDVESDIIEYIKLNFDI